MVISYDNRKKSYDSMDDSQKQQYNDMLKNKWDDYVGNQYMKQRKQEAKPMNPEKAVDNTQKAYTGNNKQPTDMTAEEYFNNQNGTNWQNKDIKPFPELEKEKPVPDNQIPNQNFNQNVSPELDQSKFQQDPWKITVQEWTAQQTGKPDYWISTDARLNEMKGNLDHYFATSPRMFSDRETFNKVFEYNGRESEAQRQLLDSYWKRKEDMDKASQYTSWESIMNWLDNSEITTDQLNLIKDTDPEAYRKRQELQEEEIKKRIVNSIVPPLLEEISQNMINMMNNLWIQPQDALDIEWVYNDTMERTWAWQTMEDANRTVRRIEEVNNKRTAIMNRYAASTWWTVSDALAAARMQKALAPYDTEMQGLQYQYQDYANLYSQKQAAAYQAAQVRQVQASENQRVWQQRLTALWFAQTAMSYRTPEQQAQLRLQEQQAQNEMQLLQQSRLNDLNRYNAYATAKMQNQLQQELTDLSVEDEAQLKANLNNALSDYYKNYGDLIQRSQSQVVDDVLQYAKDHNVSVAQALSENFIKQLQNKPEYKAKIKANYLTNSKSWYSKITLNGKDYLLKDGELVDMDFLDDGDAEIMVQEWLASFLAWKSDWQTGWWCGTFVNDYLQSLGLKRLVKDDLQDKKDLVNVDKSDVQVWDVAIFDYSNMNSPNASYWVSENSRKYGHVAIVTDVDWANNKITLAESNYSGDKKITTTRTIDMDNKNLYGYYSPSADVTTKTSSKGYSESRIWAYDKYLANGTLPSDSKLKEMWWLEKFEAEVEAYKRDKWINSQFSQQAITEITNLRKEFDKLDIVSEYRDMQTYYDKIVASASNKNAAWDMALIFAYMKMLDPGSVVREWEFANAQQATWIPARVINAYNNALSGTRLSQEQRAEFTTLARQYLADAASKYNQELTRYRGYITYWWDANSIWEYATIPWVYDTDYSDSGWWYGYTESDIDDIINGWANM